MQLSWSLIKKYLSPLCAFCGKDRDHRKSWICTDCRASLKPIPREPLCNICGTPFFEKERQAHSCGTCLKAPPPFDRARSLYEYNGLLREKLIAYKYSGALALELALAELMEKGGGVSSSMDPSPVAIVPVPPDPVRGRARGYNPPLRLSLPLSKALRIPILWKECRRRPASAQASLSLSERKSNAKNLFHLSKPADRTFFEDKPLLVVDDVWTTGSTIREFSRFLKGECGASFVHILTLARRL